MNPNSEDPAEQTDQPSPSEERRRLIALGNPDRYVPGQPIETREQFDDAVAHLLSQPEPAPREPTAADLEREQRRVVSNMAGMRRHFLKSTMAELQPLLLATFGSDEAVEAWLRSPNPVLAGRSPDSYLVRGDTDAVRKLLRMAGSGMPT